MSFVSKFRHLFHRLRLDSRQVVKISFLVLIIGGAIAEIYGALPSKVLLVVVCILALIVVVLEIKLSASGIKNSSQSGPLEEREGESPREVAQSDSAAEAQPNTLETLPFTHIWLNMREAREWLAPRLANLEHDDSPHCKVSEFGVREISIVGVSATDIVWLFPGIINAMSFGIEFKVFMLNPDDSSLKAGGIVYRNESPAEVERYVQKPMADELRSLAVRSEELELGNTHGARLNEMATRLQKHGYRSHAECIRVCEDVWRMAAEHASSMGDYADPLLSQYHLPKLPFARQWVIGNRAFLYSVYPGLPGVGINNPVFCYSSLEDPGVGAIGARAANHIMLLEDECGGPYYRHPTIVE